MFIVENKTLDDSRKLPTLRAKLLKKTAVISIMGLLAISIFLPYTLHHRDLEMISYEMGKRAELIHIGLLSTVMSTGVISTGDTKAIRSVVDSFKELHDVKLNIFRSKYVLKQFGARKGEALIDNNVRDVLAGRVMKYENFSKNTFRYIVPYVSNKKCQKCHNDLNGKPLPVGSVLGATEFIVDITERRNATFILICKTLAVVFALVAALVFGLYRMLAENVLKPLKCITGNVARLEKEEFDVSCAPLCAVNQTQELYVLMRQLGQMALILKEKKEVREKALDDERKKLDQLRSFALQRADSLGVKNESQIAEIMRRLSRAVKDAEKFEMMTRVCEYVTYEKKEITLSNKIELVIPAALYLTNLVTCKSSVKKGAIELVLEEAIANAMVHGNLEVSSKLKEEDYNKFDAQVIERAKMPPYSNRSVKISYDYSNEEAVFIVTDEGNGFDWKAIKNRKKEEEELLTYGRGITIMQAFTSSVEYNAKGNETTLIFDMFQDSGRL